MTDLGYQSIIEEVAAAKERANNWFKAEMDKLDRALAILTEAGVMSPVKKPRKELRSSKSQPFVDPTLKKTDIKPFKSVDHSGKSADEKLKGRLKARAQYERKRALAGKPVRPYKGAVVQNTDGGKYAANPNEVANKFSLHRHFDINVPKDMSLLMSYLISWKGTGKLSTAESNNLSEFDGRNPHLISSEERLKLRDLFYGCRDRVMKVSAAQPRKGVEIQ